MSDLKVNLSIPFPNTREAKLVYEVLRVDKEPSRGGITKELTLNNNLLEVLFSGKEARKEKYEDSDADRSDNENDPSIYSLRTGDLCREIVDLRQSLKNKIDENKIFYSFEIVSMKKSGTFYRRLLTNMDKYSPLFYALTWHSDASGNNDYLPLNVAEHFPGNTLLHLAAKGLTRNEVTSILRRALARGVTNIFALQGDSLSEDGDFKYAVDLVAFIREQFGSTFCICVAGYPQMHPRSSSKELDLYYLKTKVEAGADFIITQIIFESQVFIDFVRNCQKIGIQIPIIPGILAPTNYKCLERMMDICKLDVPAKMKDNLARIQNDNETMRKFMIKSTMQIITEVIESKTTCGFHLFTLNRLPSVTEICRRTDFCNRTT